MNQQEENLERRRPISIEEYLNRRNEKKQNTKPVGSHGEFGNNEIIFVNYVLSH